MPFSRPITAIMRKRYSCRNYLKKPMEASQLSALQQVMQSLPDGPFGSLERFELAASTDEDRRVLENFGYRMELIVLHATDLELGTCWLGGTFSRSSFSHKIHAAKDEIIAAVCAVGQINNDPSAIDHAVRLGAGAQSRQAWESLFFDGKFGTALTSQAAGEYAEVLEMVRIGPSASNKQPWRIVKDGDRWHFFLQRTKGYREWWVMKLMGLADMQRIDMGIAMCHFAMAAGEAGLAGSWQVNQPGNDPAAGVAEYVITWNPEAA